MSRKALGKGLGALISNLGQAPINEILEIPIDRISPNPAQPRKYFNEQKLAALASSVKEKGIIQPILVKRDDDGYTIIAGERRWRAAQQVGLNRLPVIIKDASEKEELELSLIENIQREDINPIEEAEAYQKLLESFHYTQDYLASILGKDKSTVSNMIRLLRLEEPIKEYIRQGLLTMGHARTLLSILDFAERLRISKKIIQEGLSVRQTEKLVKQQLTGNKKKQISGGEPNVFIEALEEDFKSLFGTYVRIKHKKEKDRVKGSIEIKYSSSDELDRIISVIKE